MSIFKNFFIILLVLATSIVSVLSSNNAQALSRAPMTQPFQSDENYNVVVSKFADLSIRYNNTLVDPFYIPALSELNSERAKLAVGSLDNALFVFADKNGDYQYRISIIPKDYTFGDKIDGMKAMRTGKGAIMKSYFTKDALKEINKVVVYYIPAAKQAEYKANTIVRFTTRSGKIYSMSMFRQKANPGIKVQFDSRAPSVENLKRQESATENKITFYK